MKYISKFMTVVLAMIIILSAFSGIAVSAADVPAFTATQNIFEYEMDIGDKVMLTDDGLTITPSTVSVTDCFEITADNTSVATVFGAAIQAKGYGTSVITAKAKDDSVLFIYTVSVKKPAEKITIDQKDRVMFTGETFRLTYNVPDDQKAGNVTWTSSNDSVASVNADGVITAVGAGTAVITVASEYGASASYLAEVVELDDKESVLSFNGLDLSFETENYGYWYPNVNSTLWCQGGADGTNGCIKIDVAEEGGNFYTHPDSSNKITDIKEGERYTFSCMAKVDKLGNGAYASITVSCDPYGYIHTKSMYELTDGWEKISFDFEIPRGGTGLSIMLRMTGIGTVYYDECRFTRQKDLTDVRLFSDGLELNSIVKEAPLTTANIHYAPKATGSSKLITAVYDGYELSDVISTDVSAASATPQTLAFPFEISQLGENQTVGIMNWRDLNGIEPIDQKRTFLEKTQRSDVYNFFEVNRMRGVYGGLGDIYDEKIKALITDKGVNTLILNIIGTFYDKNILKDRVVLDKVLSDADALSDETGVKIIPKISYGANATIANTLYGEFHSGKTLVNKSGQTVEDSGLPCPRARQYWKEQITDILSVVAVHKKLVGGVIDMEMYSGYRTSYGGTCKCDTCAADFDKIYNTEVEKQPITERYAYVTENRLSEKYDTWHKSEMTDITAEVREALHKINPDFIIGCMPTYEWIGGTTEGLGTHKMPLMVFSENEYKGDMSYVYKNQADIRLRDLPAVYATGLWSTENTGSTTAFITSGEFKAKAVEAATNSMGYWIYSSNYLVGDGNTEEKNAAYIQAVYDANNEINNKYGLE